MKRKAGQSINPPLSDRERILMVIIDQLSTSQTLAHPDRRTWSSESYRDGAGDRYYAHFAPWKKPVAGDLVLARTGNVSRWKVGWYVEQQSGYECHVIREIGSDKLCNYGNESFVPIVGLEGDLRLLEGDRYRLLQKIYRAFAKGDEYMYRFGGLTFDGDEAVLRVRESHGGFGNDSVPFEIRFKWTKRMSVAAILQAMRDGGYGTKSFRPPGWIPPDKRASSQVAAHEPGEKHADR
jgi:hypothetical protein